MLHIKGGIVASSHQSAVHRSVSVGARTKVDKYLGRAETKGEIGSETPDQLAKFAVGRYFCTINYGSMIRFMRTLIEKITDRIHSHCLLSLHLSGHCSRQRGHFA